jgi:hypothetical protein
VHGVRRTALPGGPAPLQPIPSSRKRWPARSCASKKRIVSRTLAGRPLTLSWRALQAQLGTSESMTNSLAKRIRNVLPDVLAAYPDARVEATRRGVMLGHSSTSVPPRTSVLLGAARSGALTLLPGGA